MVRAFGVIRSKTRTHCSTLILFIMTVCSLSIQHGGFVESFLAQLSRSDDSNARGRIFCPGSGV
jgi:hypothetical protein